MAIDAARSGLVALWVRQLTGATGLLNGVPQPRLRGVQAGTAV